MSNVYKTVFSLRLYVNPKNQFDLCVSIAKHYLSEKKLKPFNRIVTMYLDYAEDQTEQDIVMTMKDWAEKLNAFLQFNQKEILLDLGKVTTEIATNFAETEFEKYKPIQDRLFVSDFDRDLKGLFNGSAEIL